MQELGLIGYGTFGQFLVKHMKSHFDISVYDKREIIENVKVCSLKEAAEKPLVIIAVPVQYFEELIKELKDYVKPNSLIMDVSSVKVKPVELMKKYLPENVNILGTHPLFGKQSGKDGIKGLKIVLCPVRLDNIEEIKKFLETKLELEVLVRTPEEHDKQMAYVQGLTHFIGKAINDIDIKDFDQKTPSYQFLLDIKEMLKGDSDDLFLTLERENPFAKAARDEFLDKLKQIEEDIK